MPDDEVKSQRPRYIAEELREGCLIDADDFICVAQDIPLRTDLPVTD